MRLLFERQTAWVSIRKTVDFSAMCVACNNAELPGTRKPLLIGDETSRMGVDTGLSRPARYAGESAVRRIGWCWTIRPRCQRSPRHLAERGYYRWRGEAFDVRARPEGPVLALIDRGALPSFGIQAAGVHVNGLVRAARRAAFVGCSSRQEQASGPGKTGQYRRRRRAGRPGSDGNIDQGSRGGSGYSA